MNDHTPSNDNLFRGLEPPAPPAELRAAVLGAAEEAALSQSEPELWTRIWESRPLRFAWAATVAGLIFAHALIIPGGGAGAQVTPAADTVAAESVDEDLVRITKLPRLLAGTRPLGSHGLEMNDNEAADRSASQSIMETSS